MPEGFHFVEVVKNTVIDPTASGVLPLFFFSFLNDLVGIFPFALVLAGQMMFFHETLDLAMWMKLFVFVAVPVGLGSTFGSLGIYALAYFGGKPLIEKYHRFFRFSWKDVERVNAYFRGTWYDEIIFFILRCAPVLPSIPLNVASGILRMRFAPFFVLTAVGSIIRMTLTLAAVGMSLQGLASLSQL